MFCFINVVRLLCVRMLYKLPGHKGCVMEVDFHPEEPIIVSASMDKTLFLGEIMPSSA